MNAVSFEGRECRVGDDRRWASVGHADTGLIAALDLLATSAKGPGPSDGFTTVGRYLAIDAAREFRGDILELDEPTVPGPDEEDDRAKDRVY